MSALGQAAAPQAAPAVQGLNVLFLQRICEAKDRRQANLAESLIGLASVIAGIWAGLFIGGYVGFAVAIVIMQAASPVLSAVHNYFRSHVYREIFQALDTPAFREWLVQNQPVTPDRLPALYRAWSVVPA